MSFDLTRLQGELDFFKKMPEMLIASGFHIDVIDENAFIIKSNKLEPFNAEKKYELALSALIHGNEVAGISVLNTLLRKIQNKEVAIGHSIGFCIHNEKAALHNKRFLERDLNRSFLNSENSKLEEKLARRAENIFKNFQYCIDIHQTNQASETPFFIFSYSNESMHWAQFLDSKIPMIVSSKQRHKDGSTLEFFCHQYNVIGTTIELGLAGFFDEQIQYGFKIVSKALEKKEFNFNKVAPFNNVYKVKESIYWTNERIILDTGFINFSSLKTGQKVGKMGEKDYFSPYEGIILFPKYGEIAQNTKEVFTVAQRVLSPEDLD